MHPVEWKVFRILSIISIKSGFRMEIKRKIYAFVSFYWITENIVANCGCNVYVCYLPYNLQQRFSIDESNWMGVLMKIFNYNQNGMNKREKQTNEQIKMKSSKMKIDKYQLKGKRARMTPYMISSNDTTIA